MKHVFRATWKYWWSEAGFVLALLPVFVAGTYWLGVPELMYCWLLMALISLPGQYRLFRARLEIDEEGISVQKKQVVTNISWSEARWIKLVESSNKPKWVLEIGATDGEAEDLFRFPLDHFDYRQIWRLVEQFAPPEALESDAQRKTPGYQDWAAEAAKAIADVKSPLQVSDSWLVRIGSWFILLLGLWPFYFIFFDQGWRRENNPYAAVIIASLAGVFVSGLGLLAALNSGTTEIDREKITRRTLLKSTQMRWDEITHIEKATSEYAIYGHHGRLLLPTPGFWSGKAKWEAAIFFQTQVELRGIEIKPMRSLFRSRKKNNID
jgi:hypothetical protein